MKKQITALLLALSLAVPLGLSAFAEEPSPEKDAPDSQESAVAGPDAEPEADYEPDPLGQVRFSSVEQRIRENNLQILALNEQIAALEEIDYEKQLDKLRRALNSLAGSQWTMLEMGMGSSYAYDQMNQSYSALRRQFDAIWDGDLQEDNAGIVRQLKNLEDQIALGGETMYMAILAMESQEDGLERQLAALDRQLEELRLRHKLGQISTLTLTEAEAGRASLASGLETLRMNIRVYKAQLETLLGAEQTGSIQLGGVPQVTAKQLSDMDLEAGLASAKEASYELFDAKRTLKDTQDAYHGIGDYTPTLNAEHGWPAAKYTYNNTVQNYEMKFRTLYAQVKDYKQILEASKVSASSKEASYAAAELKYRQGNISKNTLLTAEDELTAAKEAVRSAENDLFTAYNNYCWAVKTGILN
nr:TolC family protein [uncultured Oscillibacter sp.]